MKYFLIPLVFALFAGSLSFDNSAYGLECEISNMTNYFVNSDAVFLGKALSKEYYQNPRLDDRNDAITLFSVIEPFKGVRQKMVNVTSSEWFWGFNFTENNEYVVFAMHDEGRLEHALCTPTLLAAESDLEQIRKVSQNYILPPIAQVEFGVNPDEIQCREEMVLITKSSDGSPTCVKSQSIQKLTERGWARSDNWIKISNAERAIHYEIDGATITSIEAFSEYKNPSLPEENKQTWLQIALDSKQKANLQITLPRNIIDSKIGSTDDDFFVLLDGIEVVYQETKTESERILNFSIPAKTDIVEIVGYGYYNPNFNELDGMSLTELNKRCGIEKPGSKWDDTEKLCTYTNVAFPTFDYEIKTGGVTRGSQYQIVGGMVDQITYDESSNSLIISLDAQENGHIQIVLPSGLLSPPTEEAFTKYSVIQDGKEVDFGQLTPILLKIPFEKDTKQISIRGELSEENSEDNSLILQEGQSWGYIKNISILDENRIDVTMSYPSNEAHHEIYPDEYQSVIGGCGMQDGSASLSLLYLEGIDPLQNQVKFRKESKVFDGLQCNDAFWEEMTRHGYCGPPHQLISRPEQIVQSIDGANDRLNFTLDVPSYLPDGYSVQKITVDHDGMSAMIYASQKPVTSEMDSCKFMWGDRGIFLFYSKSTEEYEWEKRYEEYSKETLQKLVTIDDRIMSAEDRLVGDRFGMPIPKASEVHAYRYEDNVHIDIRSALAADELIRIAKSIFIS